MTTIDVHGPTLVTCADGELYFDADGHVTVSNGRHRTSASTDTNRSNLIELWCGDDSMYFVGEKGSALWFARPSSAELAKVLDLDRLDLVGAYDPGGFHRVEFHELDDADLLLVYELGVARCSTDGRVQWHYVHDQLTARLRTIGDGFAIFDDEAGSFVLDLNDGRGVPGK